MFLPFAHPQSPQVGIEAADADLVYMRKQCYANAHFCTNKILAWLALAAILVVLPYLINPVGVSGANH
jgi:hypothetical protein